MVTIKNTLIHTISSFVTERLLRKGILQVLTDKQFILCDYFINFGKFPNLQNPLTFTEKLQWMKLYGGLESYSKYVDKLEARKYISKTVGKNHLVPIYGSWRKFEETNFSALPKQFVLKATHGSAYVFVCKDKSSLNIPDLKNIVTAWMREDFYKKTREIQYKYCKPMIFCEKYLEDERGELVDYKIFCSNGKPHIIEVVWDRFTDHKGDVYKDLNWKTLNISYAGTSISKRKLAKPKNLGEMLEISKKLSNHFPFVRVDMYSIHNKIYVGELTFTPANGSERFDPPAADFRLGELIDISRYHSISHSL